jgi:16S rRNA (uracil1498-N3)-methyltransferase
VLGCQIGLREQRTVVFQGMAGAQKAGQDFLLGNIAYQHDGGVLHALQLGGHGHDAILSAICGVFIAMSVSDRVLSASRNCCRACSVRPWRNPDLTPFSGGFAYNNMMTSPRFFCPEPLALGASLALPENAARHAARVLRLGPGAELTLFDGQGGEYTARIASVRKDEVQVDVLALCEVERESPLRVTLVQALQSGDKMDLTVQKAVELGVAAIQPVSSRRSVVRLDGERAVRRGEHWRGVAASACEQCGRNRVPVLAGLLPIEQWLASLPPTPEGQLRLMLAPGGKTAMASLQPAKDVILLVGAEGGLDPQEAAAAASVGFVPVHMGPRILRTETAGLAALAVLQALWGDFRGDDNV